MLNLFKYSKALHSFHVSSVKHIVDNLIHNFKALILKLFKH